MKYLDKIHRTLGYPRIYGNNPMLDNSNNPTSWVIELLCAIPYQTRSRLTNIKIWREININKFDVSQNLECNADSIIYEIIF